MSQPEILIVDDDPSVLERLQRELTERSFGVTTAATMLEAIRRLNRQPSPAAMILDIFLDRQATEAGLPEDGLALLKWVRRKLDLPVVMLTAVGAESVKILSFNWGADDYVTKPFSTREVAARLKAILRRRVTVEPPPEILRLGPVIIDCGRHQVSRDGQAVDLTHREMRVLEALARAGGNALSRDQILDAAWGIGHHSEKRTVDVHIRHLRKKLETDPSKPEIILTVRGVGYRCGLAGKQDGRGDDVASAA